MFRLRNLCKYYVITYNAFESEKTQETSTGNYVRISQWWGAAEK